MVVRKARLVASIVVAVVAVAAVGWRVLLSGGEAPLPSFEAIRGAFRPSEALLLDRNGEPLDEIRIDPDGRRLPWVALNDVSPAMVRAIIASEDRRFRSHRGVDWVAVAAAGAGNVLGKGWRGASTISMQLAAILDKGAARRGRGGRRTPEGKLSQFRASLALERQWGKEQILEAYLNLVSYRGELQGIHAASQGLFGKAPAGLTDAESIVLAALVRSPNAPADRVARRAAALARSMGIRAPEGELSAICGERLPAPYRMPPRARAAPIVARKLLSRGGERLRCTLDAGVQRFASEALARQIEELRGRNLSDGAVLVVENRSGRVLAYVANAGERSAAPCVDGITARRQAGSTLKPFLYALAIERRMLTAASLLDDSPLDVPTSTGMYRPRNYDGEFHGPVSVRTALSSSLNVPAVRAVRLVGENAFARRLRSLGFQSVGAEDDFGASLALGSADVTLFELVGAYRAIARGGLSGGLTLLPEDRPARGPRVISADASYVIADILADSGARSGAFGLDNPLGTPFRAAVKTGTSKDMRDNWCVGFSDRYTVGVWVGNFNGAPMWNVSGVSGAAPVWQEVMMYLHKGNPPSPAAVPVGVVSRAIDFPGGVEPGRTEWFVSGTEPSSRSVRSAAVHPPRIAYPSEGMVIALDPDIPAPLQRVFFESRDAGREMKWRLDGQVVGKTAEPASCRPEPGAHTLEIVDADGRTTHAVRFSVRGRLSQSPAAEGIPPD
jgi:penicillin-binding protein 1C